METVIEQLQEWCRAEFTVRCEVDANQHGLEQAVKLGCELEKTFPVLPVNHIEVGCVVLDQNVVGEHDDGLETLPF